MKDSIKKWLVFWLTTSFTTLIFWVSYATYQTITQVNPTDTLSAETFNKLITNQEDLKTRLDSLPTNNILQVVTNTYESSGTAPGWLPSNSAGFEVASINFTPISSTSKILVQTSSVSIHEESNLGDNCWLWAWADSTQIWVNWATASHASFNWNLNVAYQSLNHSINSWWTTQKNIIIRAWVNNWTSFVNHKTVYDLSTENRQIGITIMEIAWN